VEISLNGIVFHASLQITVISGYYHSFLFVLLLLLIYISLCFLQAKRDAKFRYVVLYPTKPLCFIVTHADCHKKIILNAIKIHAYSYSMK